LYDYLQHILWICHSSIFIFLGFLNFLQTIKILFLSAWWNSELNVCCLVAFVWMISSLLFRLKSKRNDSSMLLLFTSNIHASCRMGRFVKDKCLIVSTKRTRSLIEQVIGVGMVTFLYRQRNSQMVVWKWLKIIIWVNKTMFPGMLLLNIWLLKGLQCLTLISLFRIYN
jgi:hypothetical protein